MTRLASLSGVCTRSFVLPLPVRFWTTWNVPLRLLVVLTGLVVSHMLFPSSIYISLFDFVESAHSLLRSAHTKRVGIPSFAFLTSQVRIVTGSYELCLSHQRNRSWPRARRSLSGREHRPLLEREKWCSRWKKRGVSLSSMMSLVASVLISYVRSR
jgi:hypothetical protein